MAKAGHAAQQMFHQCMDKPRPVEWPARALVDGALLIERRVTACLPVLVTPLALTNESGLAPAAQTPSPLASACGATHG